MIDYTETTIQYMQDDTEVWLSHLHEIKNACIAGTVNHNYSTLLQVQFLVKAYTISHKLIILQSDIIAVILLSL